LIINYYKRREKLEQKEGDCKKGYPGLEEGERGEGRRNSYSIGSGVLI
jgi:hypothetical protein